MRILIAVMLTLVLSGCFASGPSKATEELAIREATFRFQIARDASTQKQTAACYFLSIYTADGQNSDPAESFMKRFSENKPLVGKVSECMKSFEKGVVHKNTGVRGIILSTGPVRWTTDTEAAIYGSESEGNLGSVGETFYLNKINGEWKVVRSETQWVS